MVVLYSCFLCLHPEPLSAATSRETFDAEQKGRILDKEMCRQQQYHALLNELGRDLLGRRVTLRDAVAQLAQTEKAQNPRWMNVLHRTYPGRSNAECLAVHLISHALSTLSHDRVQRQALASQFETEYQTTFGSEMLLDLTGNTEHYSASGGPGTSRRSRHGIPAPSADRSAGTPMSFLDLL
jgi:hypothetical protein